MIIDLILDRKDGKAYSPHGFYVEVLNYREVGEAISQAMDEGTEQNIKDALCKYVKDNDYNDDIINYIKSVKWIEFSVDFIRKEEVKI